MGIFRAAASSVSGTAKDTWKEFFSCDSLSDDIMMVRGKKVTGGNNKGDDNVITDGSIYTVADGQAAIVTSQGKVVETTTEPGEHVFHSEYSSFALQKGGISKFFKEAGRRFAYGGDVPAVVERIYYLNTKIMSGGSFGPIRVPYRFKDRNTGADIDCNVVCAGTYTFSISDPYKFYRMIAGNIIGEYRTDKVIHTMNAEFASIMQSAVAMLSQDGVRSYELAMLTDELTRDISKAVSDKWTELRGIEIVTLSFTSFSTESEDKALINSLQHAKALTDPAMAGATLVAAQADAMVAAAKNSN